MMQIGESSVDQGPDEVQRKRRALVTAQQQLRIWLAVCDAESRPVYEIAAVARQRHPIAGFGVGGTRLGVLPRESADTYHRLLETVQQDQAHLQQDLEFPGDRPGFAVVEGFGTVSALEQEPPPLLRVGDLALERLDLPGNDDRWQLRQGRQHAGERRCVAVGGLLHGGPLHPARRGPVVDGRARSHGRMLPRIAAVQKKPRCDVESRPSRAAPPWIPAMDPKRSGLPLRPFPGVLACIRFSS